MAAARPGGTDTVKKSFRAAAHSGVLLFALMFVTALAGAQAARYERTFTSPATDVERVVRNLRPSSSGRLPTVLS